MPRQQLWCDLDHLLEKLMQRCRVVFVFVVHRVAQLADVFPAIDRCNAAQFFHVQQHSGEGLGGLLFFDGDGFHDFTHVLLVFAEADTERCQCFVLVWLQGLPV